MKQIEELTNKLEKQHRGFSFSITKNEITGSYMMMAFQNFGFELSLYKTIGSNCKTLESFEKYLQKKGWL